VCANLVHGVPSPAWPHLSLEHPRWLFTWLPRHERCILTMVIGTTLHSRGENLRFGLHWLDPQVKQYEVTTHCLGIAVLTLICWMCHLECKSLLRPFSLDLATSTQVYFFLCYCRIWCLSFRFSCVRDWLIILWWRSPANVLIWSPQRVVSHGSRTPTAQLFFFKKEICQGPHPDNFFLFAPTS
jgi:hypothetical protein